MAKILGLSEIENIESYYDLKIKKSKFLGKGSGNTNYLLETDKGLYVFSVIEEQSRDEVEAMAKTLLWLELNKIQTSKLIRPQKKSEISIILREKPCLLKSYVEGSVSPVLNNKMLKQLGISIAKLHEVPLPDFLTDKLFYEEDKFKNALCANIDIEYEEWAKYRIKKLNVEHIEDLPISIIHSDLFYDNMLFEGEKLVGMIDFELTCAYHSVFDIAMAIVGTCNVNEKISLDKAKHIINGYNSVRFLEDREFEVLKVYTEYAAILTSLWRYWRYKIYQPGSDNESKYYEMVNLARSIEKVDFNILCR